MYFPASRNIKISSIIILLLGMIVLYSSSIYIKTRVDLTYNNTKAYFSPEKSAAVVSSTGTRLELWKTASIIFSEHPVFGIGSGQFKQALKEKIDSGEIEKVHLHTHVHNEPLQILVITGIVGLLAYLTLYGGMAYYFYHSLLNTGNLRVRYLSFVGIMIIGGFFMFGLTNYSFAHHVMALFFSVIVVVFAGMISSIENNPKEQ
jgi:O-antigen ligase